MPKTLTSQVFATGTKIIVTDLSQDTTFGAGTTGFVSYVKGRDQDYDNVVYYRIVTTKRGKGGKERIELNDISTPIFEVENKNILELMPDEKRRYYVHIQPLPMPDDVLQFSDLDFLAFGFAYSRWIRKLNTRAKHVQAWPGDPHDIMNTFVRMDDYFAEDAEATKDQYGAEEIRETLMNRLRVLESTLVKCSLSYMKKVADIEVLGASLLPHIKGASQSEKSLYKETIDAYKKKSHALNSLVEAHSPQVKSTKAVLSTFAKDVSWS